MLELMLEWCQNFQLRYRKTFFQKPFLVQIQDIILIHFKTIAITHIVTGAGTCQKILVMIKVLLKDFYAEWLVI